MSKLHSKRMVLIPEEVVSLLRERQEETVSPITRNLVSLKEEMGDILERQDLRPDEKAKLYGQAFQRYQNVHDQKQAKPISVQLVPPTVKSDCTSAMKRDVKPSDQVSMEIVQSLPKTLKNRAELLLQKLKQHGEVVNWNDRGELVYNGKEVRGSNMLDLVNDILRNRRKTSTPQGWEYFARGLAHMNIPNELIQNINRRRTVQQYKQATSDLKPLTAKATRNNEEEDWTDDEILSNEDVNPKRLLFSPTLRKRKIGKLTPHRKRSDLSGVKKRLARWSPLPYGD